MSENENEMKKSVSALREEAVLQFWKEGNIFEKSLEKESPKGKYIFYDGPPFATGLPHYGHILGSTVKDVIGRYKTMSGFNVPRRWGWDCHGLPIENIVEKDLGISGKKAIEELGIDKFTEHARSKVLIYVSEWKKTVDRMGRWVDFDNSYKTMDNTFIESVWWALGEMNKKGLLYEGVRVLAYCPRCETPIANSEIAMDNSYKDITDISVYAKFKLTEEENTYLLVWTTTPWTLPGNTAIAINKDIDYVKLREQQQEVQIDINNNYNALSSDYVYVAKDCLDKFKKINQKSYQISSGHILHDEGYGVITGSKLVGKKYEPIFSYYKNSEISKNENIWKVWHADFITLDKGTGIAHQAPAFGEDDMNLAKEYNIPFIRHVEPNGTFTKEVSDFAGMKVKPKDTDEDKDAHLRTDIEVIKYLQDIGAYFDKEKIIHSYPHCYRCETPLLYYALPSWFVNIQKVKKDLLEKGEDMNWVPSHLKEGRFKNTMESAPDWTISRNRYWASPLPIWKNKEGKVMMVNSLEDLKSKTKKSGNKYFVMRHGEAESNLSDLISSDYQDNVHLTELGQKQVVKTCEEIKKENFDFVFCSDFIRTKETVDIIKKEIGLKDDQIIFDSRLRELNAGSYNGKKWSEYPRFFDKGDGDVESLMDVKKRISSFLYDIESKYQNRNILIVGHESPLRLSFAYDYLNFNFKSLPDYRAKFPVLQNAEIRKLDFIPVPHNKNYELDLHRPYIDSIILTDEKGEEYSRIPEVIDCWFESGSMPFAQDHYPFENKTWREENFPAGFVAEYIAQTRTWFYYTHAISTILFDHAPFENVVTTGTVLAEDGSKMAKSKNNYPDPWVLFDKYGVDALRFYLMSSTLMKGEDVNFSEKLVQEISSKIINRFNNVVTFYELYRDINIEEKKYEESKNVLDKWILGRLRQLIIEVKNNMEAYDISQATRPFDLFVDDLSTWYLRRSRERIKDGDFEAKQTLYFVLKNTIQLFAPFMPFLAEDVWQKLKLNSDPISVHLTNFFLDVKTEKINLEILEEMQKVRDVVTLGLQDRQRSGIPVRQPLSQLRITNYELGIEYQEILKDELNVKEVEFIKGDEQKVEIDTNITEELKSEGQYRELVRAIQDIRKSNGLNPSDIVTFVLDTDANGQELVSKFKTELQKAVSAKEIKIEENTGTEIKIGETMFKIIIEK